MDLLEVTFIDELYTAEPSQVLTFGREADIVVDEDNLFMHRQVGRFAYHNEIWWLKNIGRRIELKAFIGTAPFVLPPQQLVALTEAEGTIRFEAGAFTYELGYSVPNTITFTLDIDQRTDPVGDTRLTRDFAVIPLNEEQQLLLTALCEHRLRDPTSTAPVPANAEMASRLGWSSKKFDRKLDYLCKRLADLGVRGLRGGRGLEATARRTALLEHALRSGMVTSDDIHLLDGLGNNLGERPE